MRHAVIKLVLLFGGDRVCAFLRLLIGADAAPICTTGWWGDRGADWLLVGFVLVRGLLLSAKHLSNAAKAT